MTKILVITALGLGALFLLDKKGDEIKGQIKLQIGEAREKVEREIEKKIEEITPSPLLKKSLIGISAIGGIAAVNYGVYNLQKKYFPDKNNPDDPSNVIGRAAAEEFSNSKI